MYIFKFWRWLQLYSMVIFSKSECHAGGARSPFMDLAKLVRYSDAFAMEPSGWTSLVWSLSLWMTGLVAWLSWYTAAVSDFLAMSPSGCG